MLRFIRKILWPIIGYNNSLFDNRFMMHIAGGYMVCHIAPLFLKNNFWIAALVVAFFKEACDHWILDCGGNEIKHFYDILSWNIGGLSYYGIVLLKRRRFKWE